MEFALSTSWNAFKYSDGKSVVTQIKALGFNKIELSFNLTAPMVEDIAQLVLSGQVQVTSLHNYCPIPQGKTRGEALPDCYSLASPDFDERQLAVKYTKKTVETAQRLGAQAVVLHTGRVEIPDRTRELIDLFIRGKIGTPEYTALKDEVLSERATHIQPYWESLLRSLDELSGYAQQQGVWLGVETRYYLREIPFLGEFEQIFSRFKGAPLFYWHDVGHAQLMENIGVVPREEFLRRYSPYMRGLHLHDITGYHDHKAPAKGEYDFSRLKPYLRDEMLLVIEAHHPATGAQIIAGRKHLADKLGDKYESTPTGSRRTFLSFFGRRVNAPD